MVVRASCGFEIPTITKNEISRNRNFILSLPSTDIITRIMRIKNAFSKLFFKKTKYFLDTEMRRLTMLKACKYCGRIHPIGTVCKKKPKYKCRRNADIVAFRNSTEWISKREQIKERDNYLCVACLNNLHGILKRINGELLSVHHIIPIAKAWELRLDDDNLITLCRYHHELAERGTIGADELQRLLPPTL